MRFGWTIEKACPPFMAGVYASTRDFGGGGGGGGKVGKFPHFKTKGVTFC
jgi:hypothetical protein